ncbi:MAG: DMT family transporter [Chthonomonas sp.]|nr:DMT family transporter [Chthonomonas sp.]
MKPTNRFLPNPYLTLTVLAWGFNFVAVKSLYQVMPPAALALTRWVVMLFALVPLCLVMKEPLRFPSPRLALQVLFLGSLTMGVYMFFFLEGAKQVTPGESSILISTSPIWVLFFEALFRLEKLRWGSVIGAVISCLGVALVVGHSSGTTTMFGILMTLAAAVIWGLCVVISRVLGAHFSPLQLITLGMPGALIVIVPYGLGPALGVNWASLSPRDWYYFFHIALLAGALGFYGFFTGVQQLGPGKAMRYQFFVPIVATISALVVLGIPVTLLQGLGVLVVIAGVWIASAAKFSGSPAQSQHQKSEADPS